MVNRTMRGQCRYLYVFNVDADDGLTLAKEWNKDELKETAGLGQGEYLYCSRFGNVERKRIFYLTGS
jgi:hypothetical protein